MSFFDMPSCGGCRTCEMACSFHHKEEFNPAISSIRIVNQEGEVPFRVWLARDGEMLNPDEIPCDGCKGIAEPLCLQFCRKKEDLKKILDEFLNSSCGRESF
jgi:Fe-S-cluster-containing dehydrogenase component